MPKDAPTETPFFIAVVAAIERKIGEGDRIARANDIQLTDAQIISLLTKVAEMSRGKTVRVSPPRLPRDQILTALTEQLVLLRGSIFEMKVGPDGAEIETLFPTEHWLKALKVVQKSVRHGTGHLRGSRGFLDSLSIFLAKNASANGEEKRLDK